jgi:GDP-L-fucose synthase
VIATVSSESNMRSEFWSRRRVIVTGGAGFLGQHVVDRLRGLGTAEVIVPRSADYDLRDREAILRLLADSSSDHEGHLAGLWTWSYPLPRGWGE